jgi:glycosyltransferase involved in cell wall biosynthesis
MSVQALVFSLGSEARYRAGRSIRALRWACANVVDGSEWSANRIADFLAGQQPVWLVRAGAWPVQAPPYPPPAPSATGQAVCALGLVRPTRGASERQAEAWAALREETGGDFSLMSNLRERLPGLASVYLEAFPAGRVARRLQDGEGLGPALAAEIASGAHRVIHFPALDVHDDPGLRVVQVVTSLHQGGAERVALNLTRELGRYGVCCLLATLGRPTRGAFPAPACAIDLAARFGKREERFPALAKIACEFGADLLHAHLLEGEEVARLAQSELPLVVTVHNTRPGWPAGLTSLQAKDANLLVGCAQAVAIELHEAGFRMPVRSAWNGVDFAPLPPAADLARARREVRDRFGIDANDLVLLALANPRPQKRLHLLPAALAATRAELVRRGIARDACLLLAGETSRLNAAATQAVEEVRVEVARLGLEDRVHWAGAVDEVGPVLAAADVLVFSSAHEGLSLAQIEGLAAGLPLVATDVGGTAELARNNPAVTLVPPDCGPECMADAIVDEAQCFGSKSANPGGEPPGRIAAARDFTSTRMAERYTWLYPRVLARRPSNLARRETGIWLITNNFSTGGAQSSARRLILGLAQENVRVRAAVLEESPQHPTAGHQALKEAGVPVLTLPRVGTVDSAKAAALLLEAIDHDLPEAVLLWNVIPEYKILLADALLEVPVYDVSPGEMYFTSLERYFGRPRPGLPYQRPADYGRLLAGVIVKYQAEVTRAAALGAPVHVIPNGIPVDACFPNRKESQGRLIIGTAVRLSPQKKLEQLLEALRLAHGRLPPYVLRVAGGVEHGAAAYAEELRRLAKGLCVEWVSETNDIWPFLGQCDLFAMIAEPAGCPNASLEAMAAGLPVIITDVGGAAEQIEDRVSGRVVPPGNAAALAEAIIGSSRDAVLRARWGAAGRERLLARFSLSRMVADYRRVCLGTSSS